MNNHLSLFALALLAGAAPAAHAQISGFSTFAPANGSAVNTGNSLALTTNTISQAGSAFSSTPQDISRGFDTSFVYTVTGAQTADGLTFTLQNDPRGTTALGTGGGYLGYGGGTTSIVNSAAIEFNFNQSNSTGFDTNGSIGTPTNILNGVILASGRMVGVHLVYDGATLTETLTQVNNTFSVVYNIGSLQTALGGSSAFVGFTGSDGGGTSTQTVTNFTFANSPAAVPETSTTIFFGLLLMLGLASCAVAKKKPVV